MDLRRGLGPSGRRTRDLFARVHEAQVPPTLTVGNNAPPHRGLETVAILLEGEFGYRDSLGNRGVLKPGSVEWMTAGSGIVGRWAGAEGQRLPPSAIVCNGLLSIRSCARGFLRLRRLCDPSFADGPGGTP